VNALGILYLQHSLRVKYEIDSGNVLLLDDVYQAIMPSITIMWVSFALKVTIRKCIPFYTAWETRTTTKAIKLQNG